MHITYVDPDTAWRWQQRGADLREGLYVHANGVLVGPYPTMKHIEIMPHMISSILWGDRPCKNLVGWSNTSCIL